MQEFVSKLPAGLFKSDTSLQHLVSLDERDTVDRNSSIGVEVEWVLGVSFIIDSWSSRCRTLADSCRTVYRHLQITERRAR